MTSKLKILLSSLCALSLIEGCRTPAANPDAPALIIQPNEASRAELRKTLSGLFGGREINLADDALTDSSLLVLQHARDQESGGRPALGRDVARPFRFQLIKKEDDCFLVDMRDGKRYLLADTICVPEHRF